MSRELDAEVAEKVMGFTWRLASLSGTHAALCPPNEYQDRALATPDSQKTQDALNMVPRYSIWMAAAMKVEDRIAELGLQNDYIVALWANRDRSVNFWTRTNMESFWAAIHATAEQRCLAALEAIKK
jgi:hypothetical protein